MPKPPSKKAADYEVLNDGETVRCRLCKATVKVDRRTIRRKPDGSLAAIPAGVFMNHPKCGN